MGGSQSEEFCWMPRTQGRFLEGLERKQISDLAPVPWKDWIIVHFTFLSCIPSVVVFLFFLHAKSVRGHCSLRRVIFPGVSALTSPCRFLWMGRIPELPQDAKEIMRKPGSRPQCMDFPGVFSPEKLASQPKPCLHGIGRQELCTGHFPPCSAYIWAGAESAKQ